jgi:peptide/nickel transport system substrate-binding protein
MTHLRRLTRSCFAVLGLFGLLALALAGCGGGGSSSGNSNQPVRGGTLAASLSSEPKTMDPINSGLFVDREVQLNMNDTLVTLDANGKIQADLATSWTYPDQTTLVFTLRPGVQFQDGTPFDANAVVFNMNRYLKTAGSLRKTELATIQTVTAVDTTHVQFKLAQAFAPLLATLTDRAGEILSPTALQAPGADPINNPVNMGTGPFKFKEWAHGDHITLVANPTYWGKNSSGGALPYLDAVKYVFITDGTVAYTNLQANSIQWAEGISATSVAAAKANPSVIYKTSPGLSFAGIELNTKAAPLNDAHVRRAIAWAINRDEIVHSVFLDNVVTAQGPISPVQFAFDPNFAPYHTDDNQAKSELQQASTQTPTFNLIIASGSQTTVTEANFIQSELKAGGITVNIVSETFAKETDDTDSFHYQAALIGWSGRADPDGNMYNFFHSGGAQNQSQYLNSDVEKMLDDARLQSDVATRTSDYQKAQTQIMQDSPYIFIDHGTVGQVSSSKLQGYITYPTGIPQFGPVYLSK